MSTYENFDGQWHTEYMKKVKRMHDSELHFVIKDCKEALKAYPETSNCNRYLDEILYCQEEIKRREVKTYTV